MPLRPCRRNRSTLKESIVRVLTASGRSSDLELGDAKPGVILVVGVNGGGKTTTIGKLAHKLGREGAQARPPTGFLPPLHKQLCGLAPGPNPALVCGHDAPVKAYWQRELDLKYTPTGCCMHRV